MAITDMSTEDLHEHAADFMAEATEDRDNGDYAAAEDGFQCAISALTVLAERDPAQYEPYLYAAWDEYCLLQFNNLRQPSKARYSEQKALEIARRCKARKYSDAVADDIALFERRLHNDL